jgi:hypothetical protein
VRAAVFAGYWRALHGSPGHPSVEFVRHGTVEYSWGTHRVLTRAVDRTVRCATPPGFRPTARSVAHVCGTTACTLRWVSGIARRGTWLAMLAGYSTGTRRPSTARRSAPVRQHCGGCLVTATHSHCARVRVRSADTRADGHGRADQHRRHQPAHACADGTADVCDIRADLIADVFRRCVPCSAAPFPPAPVVTVTKSQRPPPTPPPYAPRHSRAACVVLGIPPHRVPPRRAHRAAARASRPRHHMQAH